MEIGFSGMHLAIILLVYVGGLAVVGALLYAVVRLAVRHALTAHTRWIDQGKP